MNNIEKLHFKKLITEYTFYQTDIEYKKEITKEAEVKFLNQIRTMLVEEPVKLKTIETTINHIKEDASFANTKDGLTEKIPPSAFEKKIFHEISKVSHPDKLQHEDRNLEELYIMATEAYNSHDVIALYKMAIQLNIDYEIDDAVRTQVELQIKTLREKSNFLDKNLAYQWIVETDEDEKNKILKYYINNVIKQ